MNEFVLKKNAKAKTNSKSLRMTEEGTKDCQTNTKYQIPIALQSL